jgi:hypothetical protein
VTAAVRNAGLNCGNELERQAATPVNWHFIVDEGQ